MDDNKPVVSSVMITASFLSVDNKESRRMQKLIGKALTMIRISEKGFVLEFNPFGEIQVKTMVDINCSIIKNLDII